MRKSSIIKVVIDLIEYIVERKGIVDYSISSWVQRNRFAGSKDRKQISSLIWHCFRNFHMYHYCINGNEFSINNGNKLSNLDIKIMVALTVADLEKLELDELKLLFDNSKYGVEYFKVEELERLENALFILRNFTESAKHIKYELPKWLFELFIEHKAQEEYENQLSCLKSSADFYIRVNEAKIAINQLTKKLKLQNVSCQKSEHIPSCLKILNNPRLTSSSLFKQGNFFIQDFASQLVIELLDIIDTDVILDYCAGVGGKSLGISLKTNCRSQIYASDLYKERLLKLKARAKVLGINNIKIIEQKQLSEEKYKEKFSWLLLDVPCSSLGRLRRDPLIKLYLNEEELKQLIELQQKILKESAIFLKSGGHLAYITCSLLDCENEQQIERFLYENKNFELVPIVVADKIKILAQSKKKYGVYIEPHIWNSDGLYLSVLRKK